MNFLSKKNYFRLLAFILLITASFLPVVANNLPPLVGSYRFVWAPLWLLSVLVFYPEILKHKLVNYLLFYGLIFLIVLLNSLWINMRDWDRNMIKDEYYTFLVSISVIVYFRISKDYTGLALFTKLAVVIIIITALLSIISSFIDPMYARNLSGNWYEPEEKEYFSRLGGGTYGFASALVSLFPIGIYFFRNNKLIKLPKLIIVAVIIVLFFTLIRMQIFANVLIATFSIVFSMLGSKRIKRSFAISGLVLLIVLLIPASYYSDLLSSASTYFNPSSETYYKLNDLASFFSGDYKPENTGAGARLNRYPLLINAFIVNPMTGFYTSVVVEDIGPGGHLYWMNKLAISGILGFIPFVLIHYLFIKWSLKYFDKEYLFYYLVSVVSLFTLGLFKNIVGREIWYVYFILLHGFHHLPLSRQYSMNKVNGLEGVHPSKKS